jgi:hypothetical protein
MWPHSTIRVVRKWCDMHVDPIHRCLDDSKGLNSGYLPSGHGPQVHELANAFTIGTAVPSQDLSGAWVTVQG